jgi:F-type H+-transporting ATPase subunit alpha
LPVAAQIAALLAVTEGVFDATPLEQMAAAEQAVREQVTTHCADIGRHLAAGEPLHDSERNTLLATAQAAVAHLQSPLARTPR